MNFIHYTKSVERVVFNMVEVRIKKAVIREDLLSITNDYRKAIILNQFIYWSERVSDADKFIQKENEIAKSNGEEERELFYGWIYKTAEELADEVMLGLSASQIRRYISDLVDMGYISKRNNPKYKWDRTLQYRVNLVNIAKDLKKNGYPLSDYRIEIPENEKSNAHECAINNEPMKNQTQVSEEAIPENTTENTNIDYNTDNISPTELNTNKFASSPTGLHTSLSDERKARGESKYKWVATKNHIVSVMDKLGYGELADETQSAIEVFRYYYMMYKQKIGKAHPRLNDKAMTDTLVNFIDSMSEIDCIDCDDYECMIDEHFSNNYGKEIDYSIRHFMNIGILKKLYKRLIY